MLAVWLVRMRNSAQICPKVGEVSKLHPGISRVWKDRVIMGVVWGYAPSHSGDEVMLFPTTNTMLRISSNVGRIKSSKRGFDGPPTGEKLAAVFKVSVACYTPRCAQQICATHNLIRV